MGWLDDLLESFDKPAALPPELAKPRAKPKPKPAVKHVFIQIAAADLETGNPGSVEDGYYVIDEGVLKLTDSNGRPIGNDAPQGSASSEYRHELRPGDNEEAIAMAMARTLWRKRTGASTFNRRLGYARGGFA